MNTILPYRLQGLGYTREIKFEVLGSEMRIFNSIPHNSKKVTLVTLYHVQFQRFKLN
jgi:hypothetical protein